MFPTAKTLYRLSLFAILLIAACAGPATPPPTPQLPPTTVGVDPALEPVTPTLPGFPDLAAPVHVQTGIAMPTGPAGLHTATLPVLFGQPVQVPAGGDLFVGVQLEAAPGWPNDGLAVRTLRESERGTGNGVQVGGYYVGQVLGGGAVLLLYDRLGWTAALLAMAVVLIFGLPL